jgi:transcriptional regulator with XRE-family HTH domain
VDVSIGARIKAARTAAGMTQMDVARRTELSLQAVGDIERGIVRDPHISSLRQIAYALGVPVEMLVKEEMAVPASPLGDETLMSSTDVDDWMIEHGHMDREKFLDEAEELASVEDIERAIAKLHETRDSLLDDLRNPEVRARLFPRRSGLATKEEREREALKPAKLAWKLMWEIRREYTARELGLVNYSRALFTEGETDDYLVREQDPTSEYVRERHERMVEARQVAAARELEESYTKALAL